MSRQPFTATDKRVFKGIAAGALAVGIGMATMPDASAAPLPPQTEVVAAPCNAPVAGWLVVEVENCDPLPANLRKCVFGVVGGLIVAIATGGATTAAVASGGVGCAALVTN